MTHCVFTGPSAPKTDRHNQLECPKDVFLKNTSLRSPLQIEDANPLESMFLGLQTGLKPRNVFEFANVSQVIVIVCNRDF